jgi:1-aminocyclopropane-1-carboxylate deaminase
MSREQLESFPRVPLLYGPSPLERWDRLTEDLGGKVEIWAKREDLNSGIAYGGNKTRKLEYLVADALEQGCDTLVSIGGVQSNHTRQVAAVAAKLGLKAVLVQEHWVDWDEVNYEKTGNILLSRILGADVRLDDAGFDIGFRESWQQAIDDVVASGGRPYPIPAGASDHPLGGHGFAGWAFEVEDQEKDLGITFDATIVCSVTGSTQGGMIAGFAHSDRASSVIGIDASATVEKTRDQITRIASRTAETRLVWAVSFGMKRLFSWIVGTTGFMVLQVLELLRPSNTWLGRKVSFLTPCTRASRSQLLLIWSGKDISPRAPESSTHTWVGNQRLTPIRQRSKPSVCCHQIPTNTGLRRSEKVSNAPQFPLRRHPRQSAPRLLS